MQATVTITTDGATRGNPGPGGWAALLEYGAHERLIDGEEPGETTNNVMEIVAAAAALEALKRPCHVLLRCDSQYVLEGLRGLLAGGPLPKKNRAVWERLHLAASRHTVDLTWVRGHAGDARNERVDAAANAAANRAYTASEAQRQSAGSDDDWLLALCSPAAGRPARWLLRTPTDTLTGSIQVTSPTEPIAMYHALIAGLTAAEQQPGASDAELRVVSNWELIIKQQRGEWQVKNIAHRPLHMEAVGLRSSFRSIAFAFQPTETILGHFEGASS